MKKDTPQTTKFKKLKRRLGFPEWQVMGILEAIWHMTQMSAQDGAIGRFSNEDIAATIEWDGDEDELIQHLIECGFIDECVENRLVIHDWHDHAPNWLKSNLKSHKRNFVVAKQPAKQPAKQTAKQAAKQPAKQGTSQSSLTQSSLTQPNLTQNVCSELPETGIPEPALSEFEFPTNRFNTQGETYGLPQAKIDEFIESFPTMDVIAELRKCRQYFRDNPAKRKTTRGYLKCISAWMARTHDNARGSPVTHAKPIRDMDATFERLGIK